MHVLVAPMWEVSALGVFKRVCLDLPRVFEETVCQEKQHIYTRYIWYNCRGSLSTVGKEHIEKCQYAIENAEAKHPKLGVALTIRFDVWFVESCMWPQFLTNFSFCCLKCWAWPWVSTLYGHSFRLVASKILKFRWRHCQVTLPAGAGEVTAKISKVKSLKGEARTIWLAVLRFQHWNVLRSRCVSPGPHCLCAKATSPWCLDLKKKSRFSEFELL